MTVTLCGRIRDAQRTLRGVSESDAATALQQMREPGFAMLGPTSIATIGRKPATTRGLMGAHVIPEFG